MPGYDESVTLGDTGNTLEHGVLKDKNGQPVKEVQQVCPLCGMPRAFCDHDDQWED